MFEGRIDRCPRSRIVDEKHPRDCDASEDVERNEALFAGWSRCNRRCDWRVLVDTRRIDVSINWRLNRRTHLSLLRYCIIALVQPGGKYGHVRVYSRS